MTYTIDNLEPTVGPRVVDIIEGCVGTLRALERNQYYTKTIIAVATFDAVATDAISNTVLYLAEDDLLPVPSELPLAAAVQYGVRTALAEHRHWRGLTRNDGGYREMPTPHFEDLEDITDMPEVEVNATRVVALLTPLEVEVLELVGAGHARKDIARWTGLDRGKTPGKNAIQNVIVSVRRKLARYGIDDYADAIRVQQAV